jgi:hypothetical protein
MLNNHVILCGFDCFSLPLQDIKMDIKHTINEHHSFSAWYNKQDKDKK